MRMSAKPITKHCPNPLCMGLSVSIERTISSRWYDGKRGSRRYCGHGPLLGEQVKMLIHFCQARGTKRGSSYQSLSYTHTLTSSSQISSLQFSLVTPYPTPQARPPPFLQSTAEEYESALFIKEDADLNQAWRARSLE